MSNRRRAYLEKPFNPGACLVCGDEMKASGPVVEHPTTGKTQAHTCVRGCSIEHRRVLESVGGSLYVSIDEGGAS